MPVYEHDDEDEEQESRRIRLPFYLYPLFLLYLGLIAILASVCFILRAIPPLQPAMDSAARRLGALFAPLTRFFESKGQIEDSSVR